MSYYFESEVDIKINIGMDIEELFKQCAEAVLDDAKCPYECEVNLLLVDNDSIKEINAETRDIDKATDVLSFPANGFDAPIDFENVNEDDLEFNPETGELIIGDIVISQDKVISQAEEYEHSVKRELAFLIVHSMLHLIGYDHIEESDRTVMEDKQRQVMDILNIHRV